MDFPKLSIAINTTVVDKLQEGDPKWESLTSKNENVEITLEEFKQHINKGHPFCPQHNGRRSNKNFVQTNVIAVDIDDGMTFEEALFNGFVKDKAALLYKTVSHTPIANRFRMIYVCHRTVTSAEEMKYLVQGLVRLFGGDQQCKDICRLYFGSKGCEPLVLGNVLSEDDMVDIQVLGREQRLSETAAPNRKAKNIATMRSDRALERNQQVTTASGQISPLSDLTSMTSIHCPKHNDRRASAIVVTNLVGTNGVHCRTCCTSFWPSNPRKAPKPYDFYEIEEIALRGAYYGSPENTYDSDEEGYATGLFEDRSGKVAYEFSQQYLPDFRILDGVTFIRSPKGSGKSEFLANKVNAWAKDGKRVLLVGHRQTLLASMAARLTLTCYFYLEGGRTRYRRPDDRYAICIDSIGKLLSPKDDHYDVILIDESDQVFSHLTADTLGGKRRTCYNKLFHFLRKAETIVVADADLSQVTVNSLWHAVGDDVRYRFYLNRFKESRCAFNYYSDKNHLHAEVLKAIAEGKRLYVATNSKGFAATIYESIRKKFNDSKKLILVTGDTNKEDSVVQFVANIKEEILKYDVTIASPTLGTGIDIAFESNAELIDHVYGFFDARINTHFDIDQQLSRVRHPKSISVWVTSERFAFETEPDVIKSEVLDNEVLDDVLIGYSVDGSPEIDRTYLSVYSEVTAMRRASMNNLRLNLLDLRRRNGWNLNEVDYDRSAATEGKKEIDDAKHVIADQRARNICGATKLEPDKYQLLSDVVKSSRALTKAEEFSLRRYEIESFYRQEISEDLVVADQNGRRRKKIRLLELYLTPLSRLTKQSESERENRLASDRTYAPTKKLLLHTVLAAAGLADEQLPIKAETAISKDMLGAFVLSCHHNSAKLQELFGLNIRADIKEKAIQQLSSILDLLGLGLVSTREKVNGISIRYYRIPQLAWEEVNNIVERRLENIVRPTEVIGPRRKIKKKSLSW